MQEHLNDDQLDELFRFASNGREQLAPDDAISDEVQTHLDNCEHCQEKVRAQRELLERLSLLKNGEVGLPGPECPPRGVWFEIVAGIDVEKVEGLLDHASRCDHCGPLLREAVEDCVNELTQQEDVRIAGLRSSSLEWQRELVSRLCQEEPAPAASTRDKYRWWSTLREAFTPLRLAFAASLAGLLFLGVADYRLAANLSAAKTQAEVETSRLRSDLARQNRNPVDANMLLNDTVKSRPSDQIPSVANQVPPAAPQLSVNTSPIVHLALDFGMTRGSGHLNRLAIPPGTEIVKITVQVPDIPHGALQEQLLTPDGNRIWSQTLEPSTVELHKQVLSIFLPAYLLKPNDYQIVISRESAGGTDRIGSYPFRVIADATILSSQGSPY